MSQIDKYKKNILDNEYNYGTGITDSIDERLDIKMNEYGIYTSYVHKEKENNSGKELISKIEPMLNRDLDETIISRELYGHYEDIEYNKKIGYYRDLYAGYIIEGDYRERASSGGAGTWILKELFENDLIDAVIHVKQNYNNKSDELFVYDISWSIDEIKAGAKTKYYPVELSKVIEIVRKKKARYAIVGLPAYIYSIRLLSRFDSIINERIKYTIGLICGHLKSANFTKSLAWQAGINPETIQYIDYRKKLLDRPANKYAVEVKGLNEENKEVTIIKPVDEIFGYNWGQGFFKVKASDYTDDVMNETADITIGDAWLDEYTQDSKGTNVIVIRNKVLSELFDVAIKEKRIKMDKLTEERVIESQKSHFRHTQDELSYRLWKRKKNNEWYPKKRVQISNDLPFIRKKIQDMRELIRDKSHLSFQQALKEENIDVFYNTMDPLVKKYNKYYAVLRYIKQGVITSVAKYILKRIKTIFS